MALAGILAVHLAGERVPSPAVATAVILVAALASAAASPTVRIGFLGQFLHFPSVQFDNPGGRRVDD